MKVTIQQALFAVAEASARVKYDSYMGGAKLPRGLDLSQAVRVLSLAYPHEIPNPSITCKLLQKTEDVSMQRLVQTTRK